MSQPQKIIQWLCQLDTLEKQVVHLTEGHSLQPSMAQQITVLRAKIPNPVLSHHDRMKARGKISVAPVRRTGTGACHCGACHLGIPVGRVPMLLATDDLHLCDHCGAYIYLIEEEPRPASAVPLSSPQKTEKKAVRKKRSSRS